MKYTQIPTDTFNKLQLNAGIIVDEFTPSTGTIGNLMGATSGGMTFASNPTYTDFGEDIDNCPANTYELKRITGYDPTLSGTFLPVTAALIKQLMGAADIDVSDSTHVIPRQNLLEDDFEDVWWIGDYSNINEDQESSSTSGTDGHAGYLAVHVKNALNTTGVSITSAKDAKGQFSFEFHGHYSIEAPGEVPFEFFCQAGTEPTNA